MNIPRNYKQDTYISDINIDGEITAVISMLTRLHEEATADGWINLEIYVEQEWDCPDSVCVIGFRPKTKRELSAEKSAAKKAAEQRRIANENKERQERAEYERLQKKYG